MSMSGNTLRICDTHHPLSWRSTRSIRIHNPKGNAPKPDRNKVEPEFLANNAGEKTTHRMLLPVRCGDDRSDCCACRRSQHRNDAVVLGGGPVADLDDAGADRARDFGFLVFRQQLLTAISGATAMPQFDPELIEVMKKVLEDTMTRVPLEHSTPAVKAFLAQCILKAAAQGQTSYDELIL